MRKGIIVSLIIVCMGLGAVVVFLSINADKKGPEITIKDTKMVYGEGEDKEALLAGVSASDEKDGDVSDTIIVESILPNEDGQTAIVIYVAKDSHNNISKAKRTIAYHPKDGKPAVSQAAPEETKPETPKPETPKPETPKPEEVKPETPAPVAPAADDKAAKIKAENEAALAASSKESPKITLQQETLKIKKDEKFNRLAQVKEITDDKDERNKLYQGIQISGEVDTKTPGDYELTYWVKDSKGNTSNQAKMLVTVE